MGDLNQRSGTFSGERAQTSLAAEVHGLPIGGTPVLRATLERVNRC